MLDGWKTLVAPALVVGALVWSAACTEEIGETEPEAMGGGGGMGGATTTGGAPACGSTTDLDTDGLVELAFDDGAAETNVRILDTTISTDTAQFKLSELPVHEAVRFELEHPARIHGFAVMWGGFAEGFDPRTELVAGLYADFGYNGFDFWAPDPLWTGSRCAEDVDPNGSWLSYKLDTPIDVEHPGLIYVAHRAEPGQPVWWVDTHVEDAGDQCQTFDLCQSAMNLPTTNLLTGFYNGLSLSWDKHFMVRLYVEYLDDLQPEEKIFQPVPDAPQSGHVSWGDYDNDGDDDLLLGGGLFRNEGDGTFSDQSAALLGTPASGGVWGDYDNDGCLDLFLFVEDYATDDTLLHGDCSGAFTAPTDTGIVDQQSYNDCGNPTNTSSPTAAAAWVDLDGDGFLDLYQANFNCWTDYSYYQDTVYQNQGDGTFVDISDTFTTLRAPSRAVTPIDHDLDGDMDVHVGTYVLYRNLFFQNNGDGSFSEIGRDNGLSETAHATVPYYGHTIGLAWGDLDNDGDFDNITGNLAHPRFFGFSDKTEVRINDGSGTYSDIAGDWSYPASAAGLRYQETHSVPVLADFDQDGVLDLAITAVYDGRPTDFYWGNGDGTFTLDAYHAGITTENGWGIASADFDNDGDQDVFCTELFENTMIGGHWLQARVEGVSANWAAIGAVVKVTAGGVTRMRQVEGGSGKGCQDSMYLHFGLGGATSVDEIRVRFPGGDEVVYAGPIAVDQRVWLIQDSTTALPGWQHP